MQVDPTLVSTPAVALAMMSRAAKRNAPVMVESNALHLDKCSQAHFLSTLLSQPWDTASHPLLYGQAAVEAIDKDPKGHVWRASAPISAFTLPEDCEDFTNIWFQPPQSSANHYQCYVRIN